MRLTLESNPESLKRYGHMKPARASGLVQLCSNPCPGTTRRCGLEKAHRGPHVAFGLFRKVVAVWDADAETHRPSPPPVGVPEARPGGARAREDRSLLRSVGEFLSAPFSSVEELTWIVFFLVFVGFAFGGFLLIFLG
jgi:hypothetical protein